jgi:Ala-tRNA(Pro) deacylase
MASGWRLEKYLGLKPGFLSVFGIINDEEHHVKVILDKDLDRDEALSFLPNTQGKSFIVISFDNLVKFINSSGNELITASLQ